MQGYAANPRLHRAINKDKIVSIEGIFPKVLFYIGGIPVKDSVLQTWVVIAILVGFAIWAQNRFSTWEPKTWQLAIEYIAEYVDDLMRDAAGRAIPYVTSYLTTMISFILIANLLGLLPLFQAPTRDINTTLALSLISLGSCYAYGIRERGLKGYLAHYASPIFMLPLNLLGDISRVLSMALRLFGNVVAGEVIGGVMFMLVPVLAPLPLNALGMITGVLQSLVFTMLTLVFVVNAMGVGEARSTEQNSET